MSAKVSSHYRQEKPGKPLQHKRGGKTDEVKPSLGAHGEAAVCNFDIPETERELRAFDLNSKYGPCIGLTRLERWERAKNFGLDPPARVKEMLLELGVGSSSNNNIWEGRV